MANGLMVMNHIDGNAVLLQIYHDYFMSAFDAVRGQSVPLTASFAENVPVDCWLMMWFLCLRSVLQLRKLRKVWCCTILR